MGKMMRILKQTAKAAKTIKKAADEAGKAKRNKQASKQNKHRTVRPTDAPCVDEAAMYRVHYSPLHPEWPVMNVSGTEENTLYTYDAEILNGMPDGAWIELEVVPYDVELRSSSTGAFSSSEGFGTPVAFNGIVIGITSGKLEELKNIAASGRRVVLRAKKKGMLAGHENTPEMVCQTISTRLIGAWWRVEKCNPGAFALSPDNGNAIFEADDRLRKKGWREEDLGIALPDDYDDIDIFVGDKLPYSPQPGITKVDVSTAAIPAPEGSKAKPKISVMISGIEVLQASARNGYYKTIAEHVGEKPIGAYIRKVEYETGDPTVRLVIVWA